MPYEQAPMARSAVAYALTVANGSICVSSVKLDPMPPRNRSFIMVAKTRTGSASGFETSIAQCPALSEPEVT